MLKTTAFHYKKNDNLTRIQSAAVLNKIYFLEPENPLKTKENYKKPDKSKWSGKVSFIQNDFLKFIYSHNSKNQPSTLNIGSPYIEGFETLGDVSRKRQKNLEIQEFLPNNTKGTWEKLFKIRLKFWFESVQSVVG